jgi:hypothetical protein
MFLHHALSILLILMSYLTNQPTVGLMVLFLHDTSDAFLLIGRFYADMRDKNKYLLYLLYLTGFGSWVLLRMLAFPLCCIWESRLGFQAVAALSEELRSAIILPGLFMVALMGALMVLHCFWSYFIFSAFTTMLTKKKVNIGRSY